MAAGDINMKEFARAIKYYMHAFECSKERPGELNKKEFVLFWEKFQELYNKIDANKGEIIIFDLLFANWIYFQMVQSQ